MTRNVDSPDQKNKVAWASFTAVLLVFGVFGIGLGGEMTYGQTLGFLRNPETVWWGLTGTTLKGGVWGLLGGAVLALGFIYNRIPKKTIFIALFIMPVSYTHLTLP